MAALRAWLRDSSLGACSSALAPRVAETHDACSSRDHGVWVLPVTHRSWEYMAWQCLQLCSGCRRCNNVSLSLTNDRCTWYHRCDALVGTDHRTGPAAGPVVARELAHQAVAQAASREYEGLPLRWHAQRWLQSSIPGACRIFPEDISDCEFLDVGRFTLSGSHLASWEAAVEGCLEECLACRR